MLHGLGGDLVVLVVAGVVPVVDQGIEHGAAFPPVVWVGQVARGVAGAVAGVVIAQVRRERLGGLLDGS